MLVCVTEPESSRKHYTHFHAMLSHGSEKKSQEKEKKKKSHRDIQFIHLNLESEDTVSVLHRFLFTGKIWKGLCELRKGWLAQGAEQHGSPCSSRPGSAASRACQTVLSFPKLEAERANSRFPGWFRTVNWGRARCLGLIPSQDRANQRGHGVSPLPNSAGAAKSWLPHKGYVVQSLVSVR